MIPPCICVTLNSCLTGQPVYYYTCKQTAAQVTFLSSLITGQLLEINDPTNFPETFYTFQTFCLVPSAPSISCTTCIDAPDRITDDIGNSFPFWTVSEQLICPNNNAYNDVYVLTNCLANVVVTNVDAIINSPELAIVTSTNLFLYVDMIVKIDGYADKCYTVSGPYTPGEGASVRPTVTIVDAYSTCACCLPPAPDPDCCEIPKYIQKPAKDFFRITVSDSEIKANTNFANNYYKLFMGIRHGVHSCCTGIDYDQLWIDKEISDLESINYSTCEVVLPSLCLFVTGNTICGSQVATYNDFINGKWSFKFTRQTGVNGIVYWDNQNSYWVIVNEDTGVIAAKLLINSDYPIGTNDQWIVVNKSACLSPDCGLSTWTVDCSYYEPDPCDNCNEPQNVVAE
jgi:hypothetical protein